MTPEDRKLPLTLICNALGYSNESTADGVHVTLSLRDADRGMLATLVLEHVKPGIAQAIGDVVRSGKDVVVEIREVQP